MYEDDTIGRVMEVQGSTAYVDPEPGITDSLKSRMGWAEADEDTFPLEDDMVSEVTDDEIRVETTL